MNSIIDIFLFFKDFIIFSETTIWRETTPTFTLPIVTTDIYLYLYAENINLKAAIRKRSVE